MLFIETLRNKPIFKRGNDIIKDLTSASVEFNRDVQVVDAGTVSDEMVMRPDLIARVFFRDANKLDYILKFNGISNPFSINSGDVILVPDYDDMKGVMKPKKAKDSRETREEVTKKFFDPERLSKKDNKRLEYLRTKSESMENGSKTNLPPNFAEPGSQELKVVDGKVIFGDDVVPNAERCVDPLSKARAKSKILQKKIFKNSR